MSRWRRLADGLSDRTGLVDLWRLLAEERIPGGARWSYVFGSLLLALLASQAASGLVLALDYAPTTDAAHESVSRIMDRDELPWGSVVRGMHHHGASFLVVFIVLHVVQVAIFGAYRKPRELNWLTGLALGGTVLAFAFTGYLLPWDQTAYYATRVGLNIMRSMPIVGAPTADLLQGGEVLGNLSLVRFYAIHVLVLPVVAVSLVGVHLVLFRRHGVTPPPETTDEETARTETFWPFQAARDAIAAAAVLGGLALVARFAPARLGPKADPAVAFDARPEWYFYWLFELLHHFEPPIEWLATLVIPGLVFAAFALLPWLDRAPDRRLRARRAPLIGLGVILAAMALLTVSAATRAVSQPETDESTTGGATTAATASRVTPVQAGVLYGEWCTECHARDGAPLDEDARDFRGDDFARMAAADFEALVTVVRDGGEIMPGFGEELSEEEIRAILREVVLPFTERGAESP